MKGLSNLEGDSRPNATARSTPPHSQLCRLDVSFRAAIPNRPHTWLNAISATNLAMRPASCQAFPGRSRRGFLCGMTALARTWHPAKEHRLPPFSTLRVAKAAPSTGTNLTLPAEMLYHPCPGQAARRGRTANRTSSPAPSTVRRATTPASNLTVGRFPSRLDPSLPCTNHLGHPARPARPARPSTRTSAWKRGAGPVGHKR